MHSEGFLTPPLCFSINFSDNLMRKILFLILTLLAAVNVYAASIRETVNTLSTIVPINAEYGNLVAISYNEPDNEVVAEFKCADDFLTSFDESKEVSLAAYVTGLLMSNNPGLQPFNLVLIIKTPGNSTGKTIYEPDYKMAQLIEVIGNMLSSYNQGDLDQFISSIQESPMQCDPSGEFCYTLDFNKSTNEIVGNIQFLEDIDTEKIAEEMADAMELIAESLGKEIASSFKMFEPLMKSHNIGLRVNLFQDTANEPFFTIRYTPEQLFGE